MCFRNLYKSRGKAYFSCNYNIIPSKPFEEKLCLLSRVKFLFSVSEFIFHFFSQPLRAQSGNTRQAQPTPTPPEQRRKESLPKKSRLIFRLLTEAENSFRICASEDLVINRRRATSSGDERAADGGKCFDSAGRRQRNRLRETPHGNLGGGARLGHRFAGNRLGRRDAIRR